MKKRVRKELVRTSKRERGKKPEKSGLGKVRFYDITLEIIVALFLASLVAIMYSEDINNTIVALCLTAFAVSILVFTLGILHHSIKKRAWFVSLLITALVVFGVISYAFFLYLGLFTAVLFYFIVLRKEFKG